MVRYHWQVEEGCSAHVPVNGREVLTDGICNVVLEVDMPGIAGSASACLTLPSGMSNAALPQHARSVGIMLGHDYDASSWKDHLMNTVAETLAKDGFVVMRNFCALKELRRLKMYDKCLDAAATSPYCRGINSWIAAGLGNGARVAATIGSKTETPVSAFALLSYPLQEPTPPAGKGQGLPDSTAFVATLHAPVLFVHTNTVEHCSVQDLRNFCAEIQSPSEPRLVVVPNVDSAYKAASSAQTALASSQVAQTLLDYARALESGDVSACGLPKYTADAHPPPAVSIPLVDAGADETQTTTQGDDGAPDRSTGPSAALDNGTSVLTAPPQQPRPHLPPQQQQIQQAQQQQQQPQQLPPQMQAAVAAGGVAPTDLVTALGPQAASALNMQHAAVAAANMQPGGGFMGATGQGYPGLALPGYNDAAMIMSALQNAVGSGGGGMPFPGAQGVQSGVWPPHLAQNMLAMAAQQQQQQQHPSTAGLAAHPPYAPHAGLFAQPGSNGSTAVQQSSADADVDMRDAAS